VKFFYTFAITLIFPVSGALAQDATCAKLKNPTHKVVCNCHVSNGGWVREEPNKQIRWGARGGAGNTALQNCLAKTMR
jgi:hypothetical protein